MYVFRQLCAYPCLVYDEPGQLGGAEFGRRLPSLDASLHALVAGQLPHQRTILHQYPRRSPLSCHFNWSILRCTCAADYQLTDSVHVCIQTWLRRPANGRAVFTTTLQLVYYLRITPVRVANRPVFPGTSHILIPLSRVLANTTPGRRMSRFSLKWKNVLTSIMQKCKTNAVALIKTIHNTSLSCCELWFGTVTDWKVEYVEITSMLKEKDFFQGKNYNPLIGIQYFET